jgi:hypothetical protein
MCGILVRWDPNFCGGCLVVVVSLNVYENGSWSGTVKPLTPRRDYCTPEDRKVRGTEILFVQGYNTINILSVYCNIVSNPTTLL